MMYFIINVILGFCSAVWLTAVALQQWNEPTQKFGLVLFILFLFSFAIYNISHYFVLKKEARAYEKGKQEIIKKIT